MFHADEDAICRSNLWLRTAGRVYIRLGEFKAADFGELFDQTYALPWERWIPQNGAFPVSGRSIKSQLSSVPACQQIVKKAVVEKLRAAHRVTRLAETGANYPIEVSLLKDQATLLLDTSGHGLHRRGYRTFMGEAPLRETLATGLILLSYWNPERLLVDPFCGTGTILIEAALIGRNIAPGLMRTFGAESWPTIPKNLWDLAREEARDKVKKQIKLRLMGSDISAEAISLARKHVRQAKVMADIVLHLRDFRELSTILPPKSDYGCIITNPPYAVRMGGQEEIRQLYSSMPAVFTKLPTWSIYVLTADPYFERALKQPAGRRRKLFNGPLECTYYQFLGPKP